MGLLDRAGAADDSGKAGFLELTRFCGEGGDAGGADPEVARRESNQLPAQLKRAAAELSVDWLHATLRVKGASKNGLGLHGSGMFVINPPHTLKAALQAALPQVLTALGRGAGKGFTVDAGG